MQIKKKIKKKEHCVFLFYLFIYFFSIHKKDSSLGDWLISPAKDKDIDIYAIGFEEVRHNKGPKRKCHFTLCWAVFFLLIFFFDLFSNSPLPTLFLLLQNVDLTAQNMVSTASKNRQEWEKELKSVLTAGGVDYTVMKMPPTRLLNYF